MSLHGHNILIVEAKDIDEWAEQKGIRIGDNACSKVFAGHLVTFPKYKLHQMYLESLKHTPCKRS